MKTNTKKNKLTDWDWTTLVAAWRYYEHRNTIAAAMFPHEIVTRFFIGSYDDESCRRIANQFVNIDHHNGPDDKISGWVGDDTFGECDRRAWRLFYFYLRAWLVEFATAKVTLDGKIGLVEVFRADGKWYAREGYEKYGENVAPYKDSEIEFSYCVCQIVRREKMSNERHETVADNVSAKHQFRDAAKMIPHEEVDVSKMETTTPTGNTAAMREALEAAIPIMRACLFDFYNTTDVKKVVGEMKAALSAPPRNCDVGTAEEQSERFDAHCRKHMGCLTCPLREKDGGVPKHCELAWAQMPYESEVK